MLWKPDPEVDALKKRPRWQEFHRVCGQRGLYFDRPVKQGRGYQCVAFTTKKTAQGGWSSYHLATGTGRTALDAMWQAYEESGRGDSTTGELWGWVTGQLSAAPSQVEDFEDLFG